MGVIKPGSIWKRIGHHWDTFWLGTFVVVVKNTCKEVKYRYPRSTNDAHTETTIDEKDFSLYFELTEDIDGN
jgi:hypothetical protein